MPEAKSISKIFKFISTAGIIVCAVLKWIGVMPQATVGEIIGVWSTIYGLGAGTIDINLFLEKKYGKADDYSSGDVDCE